MKAIVQEKYCPPGSLQIREVEKPVPAAGELLVRIEAVSLNPADWHRVRGTPAFARFVFGLTKPRNPVPGADVAGVVEQIGANVTALKPGDRVYGDISTGGFAEFACADHTLFAPIPPSLSFDEAAAVPIAALTALQGLRDHGLIKPGHQVLINGASGGVGTFAVQIAKALGAEVTGVCSARNAGLVSSIGADQVIDYASDDFAGHGERFDLILDAVGNRPVSDHLRALRPNGVCVVVGFRSMRLMLQAQRKKGKVQAGNKHVTIFTAQAKREDLLSMNELFESGTVKPVIGKTYGFEQLPQALAYVEEGHARGKVVVTVP